jgi:DNA-binding response OmpR family regulator
VAAAAEHSIVIIGGGEVNSLARPLQAHGWGVSSHDSVRHAFRRGRRLDAKLLIIGPGPGGQRSTTLCWRARMSGFCGTTLVLLAPGDDASVSDLDRAGADVVLDLPVTERQLLYSVELCLRRSTTAWTAHVAVGDLDLDFSKHTARLQGHVLRMRPLAFEALSYVVLYGSELIPWAEISRQLLGDGGSVASARHMMRWACAALGHRASIIERIHGHGCRRNPVLSASAESSGLVRGRPPFEWRGGSEIDK